MEKKIKELRIKIDGLAQLTKELEEPVCYTHQESLKPRGNKGCVKIYRLFSSHSREINKAVDDLFLAKAWLGKVLGELGTESPYPKDGTRKTVDDIEPTADKAAIIKGMCSGEDIINVATSLDKTTIANYDISLWEDKNHIEKVDWLRQEIQEVVDMFNKFSPDTYLINYSLSSSFGHLSEARFQLGFELERIRNEKVGEEITEMY